MKDTLLRNMLVIACNSLLTSNDLDIDIDNEIDEKLGDYKEDVDATEDTIVKDAYKVAMACKGESKGFKDRDLELAVKILRNC